MHQWTKQFYNKQIDTIVLTFVYCVELLLHVLALMDYHQAIRTLIAILIVIGMFTDMDPDQ
jgi:uncharacterized membrane-anchored protein YitT (DUF2179 family)